MILTEDLSCPSSWADALSELSGRPALDPDAQATITDFIDYTEFFPSDLFRSLTLIGKLDETFLQHTAKVHELTKSYGSLPTLPAEERPSAQDLRKDISFSLHHALRCRESSFAEAARLSTVADNLTNRISTIKRKLAALPKPPSRDPTPIPKVRSPAAQRNRKLENERNPRIKLKTDIGKLVSSSGPNQTPLPKKHRSRRTVVPGEVLPPFDPNSPGVSDGSDSEPEPRAATMPRARDKTPKTLKLPKVPKSENIRLPKPAINRLPGSSGTNVHSSVAGISVSNAMAQLEPPPPNPILGSKHAPWLSLTEWELNKIRKRMKKNADWLPSEIMVKRELAATGRGTANYLKAKAQAEDAGEDFLDEEPEIFKRPVTFRGRTSEPVLDADGEEQLVSRGMKLNEAKKLKRKLMLQEAAEREEANRRITQAGLAVNDLFSQTNGGLIGDSIPPDPKKSTSKRDKKRRRVSSPDGDASRADAGEEAILEPVDSLPKKIKLAKLGRDRRPASKRSDIASSNKGADLSAFDPADIDATYENSATRSGRARPSAHTRASPKDEEPSSAAELSDYTRSHGPTKIKLKLNPMKKAASVETPERRGTLRGDKRGTLRTSSASSYSKKSVEDSKTVAPSLTDTVASRRSKRSAPELAITSNDGDTPAQSVGKGMTGKSTKKAGGDTKIPKRHSTSAATLGAKNTANDSEDSYCLCGGPSSGRMIACDDPHCKIEWFHLECVGLNANGASYSRATWYCPDCRGKHGVRGDGIVKGRGTG